MEIIRFVLSNFWVWLGAVILILAIGQAAVEVIKAVRPSRKISAYKIGDRWRMEIDGECRRVLDAPPARTLGRDTEQGNMFQG